MSYYENGAAAKTDLMQPRSTPVDELTVQLQTIFDRIQYATFQVREASDALFGPLPEPDSAEKGRDAYNVTQWLDRIRYQITELEGQVGRLS